MDGVWQCKSLLCCKLWAVKKNETKKTLRHLCRHFGRDTNVCLSGVHAHLPGQATFVESLSRSLSTGRCTVEWRPTAASCAGRASWTASVYECICCLIQVKKSNQPRNHTSRLLVGEQHLLFSGLLLIAASDWLDFLNERAFLTAILCSYIFCISLLSSLY